MSYTDSQVRDFASSCRTQAWDVALEASGVVMLHKASDMLLAILDENIKLKADKARLNDFVKQQDASLEDAADEIQARDADALDYMRRLIKACAHLREAGFEDKAEECLPTKIDHF